MVRFADDQANWEPTTISREGRLTLGAVKSKDRILEIGPGYRPLAPKGDNWRVWTIDHATREELVAKYAGCANVNVNVIEDVDFLWNQGAIDACVPSSLHGSFDICYASHVIEHIPDFAAFFQSVANLLDDRGTLSMAVPDKRYCFDCFRPQSTTGDVLAAHYAMRSRHSAQALFDHFAYSCTNNGGLAWDQSPPGDLQFVRSEQGIGSFDLKQFNRPSAHYMDCHGWQFTPSSFSLVILELSALELIDFRIRHLYEPQGCEFIVHLQKGRKTYDSDVDQQNERLDLLKRIVLELGEQADLLKRSRSCPAEERNLAAVFKDSAKRRLRPLKRLSLRIDRKRSN